MKHNAATWNNKREFAEMECKAMAETIAELSSTVSVLRTAIKSALDDPLNWQAHLEPTLDITD